MQNPFPPPSEFLSSDVSTVTHKNGYIYANLSYLKNIVATVGASADSFKHGVMDREQLNPKLGLVWTGLPDTTLRAAVFRTLNRNPLRSQTIEPTQVAGFNQFFDESEGVKAWRSGIGIDHKLTSTVFSGAEYSQRRLDVPFLAVDLSSLSV